MFASRSIVPGSSRVALSIVVILFLSSGCSSIPEVPVSALDDREIQDLIYQAKKGDAEAQYNLGGIYSMGGSVPQDYVEAFKWYRMAAEQGYIKAQSILGSIYEYGRGVPQDYAKAVKWYWIAAEQGETLAQFSLGVMYFGGKGVPQDDAKAFKWFRMVAEQGDAGGQHSLGDMYANGLGVPQDYIEAHKWYSLAVSRYSSDNTDMSDRAKRNRDKIEKRMTRETITTAQRLAREWRPKTWDELKAK